MDEQKWNEVVRHVIPWVVEQGAFMFIEPAGRDLFEPRETRLVRAEVSYHGAATGRLLLAAQELFAIRLAANMLGRDPYDPTLIPFAPDAVAELLNMITGNLLANLHGTGADFDLEHARVGTQGAPAVHKDLAGMPFTCMFRNEDKELFAIAFRPATPPGAP